MDRLNIGSLNVRGLCNLTLRQKTFQWFRNLDLDLVFLQETFCKKTFKETFNNLWKGKIFHSFTDSSHSRGVCIMIKENLNIEIVNVHSSDDGRILLLNVKLFDDMFCLVNIYAPNCDKLRKSFFCKS